MNDFWQKIERNEDLPTLPVVMAKLIETINDDRSSASDVKKTMEKDPAISARVLKLANSAFYGLRHRVDNLQRAIVILGFETVRMLALSTTVLDLFTTKSQLAFSPKDFWLHSLGSAKSAQLLAQKINSASSPETLFTAGLLHDIGKYCIALTFKNEYKNLVEKASTQKIQIRKLEKEYLGHTYIEVNQWLAQKWHFPETLWYPLVYHNTPDSSDNKYPLESWIIQISSEIARANNFGYAGDFNHIDIKVTPLFANRLNELIINEASNSLGAFLKEAEDFLSEFRVT
ncbi:MAG: HDOD domain-containing protein [Candidatus Hydrogenedentes bacterium]|nr:HDOD domain-containing protein [Candidatus Hydrogenedentota bacterium]